MAMVAVKRFSYRAFYSNQATHDFKIGHQGKPTNTAIA
jgi:hypothetical protein